MPDHQDTKKNTMAVVITGNNLPDYSWKDIKAVYKEKSQESEEIMVAVD